MKREEFEKIVNSAIKTIPKKFLEEIENVDICVEDFPTPFQLKKLKRKDPFSILGLYEGVPKTKRGSSYGMVLPDKITVFQKPIERISSNKKEIEKIVKRVVWHEIAHHFGMDETQVQKVERKIKDK